MHEQAHLSRRSVTLAMLAGASSAAALPSRRPSASTRAGANRAAKVLLVRSNAHPGGDDDPGFIAAVHDEEAAVQALGDMIPATVTGAAAQLSYMASIEGSYIDDQSPILRTMRSVAKALVGGLPA